jgi:FkbM family methyltransferase
MNIGKFELRIPEGHQLPEMYARRPTYDFLPWKIMASVITQNKITHTPLIDVGANIGDTVAHFRTFSAAPALCVEANKELFNILQENTQQFSDVELVNGLVCPAHLIGKVAFSGGLQTGGTFLSGGESDNKWDGPVITLDEIISRFDWSYIFKTDTDGFDAEIIADLIRIIKHTKHTPAVIYYESAGAFQLRSDEWAPFVDVTIQLQELGFEILLLSNHGIPFVFAGRKGDAIISAFEGLVMGYKYDCAPCHYFDVLAVRGDLNTSAIRSGFLFP